MSKDKKSGIAVNRTVWCEGWRDLVVGPSEHGTGSISIVAPDKEYWGFDRIEMPCAMADRLAEALCRAAMENDA